MSKKKKDWKTEKERLLRMDRDDRRKEYRRQDFISLDKIPSWSEENYSEDREEETEMTGGEEGGEEGGGGGGGLSDKVSLYKGDITVLEVDAIVNAANSSLLGGGGVDGCIHKAAGACLYDECHSLNGCETGKAKITCGYDLPAKYVIHTVGPVARGHVGSTETSDLTSCYQNSLRLVKEHGLSTVAFPCISTGIYGFPNEPAANIALNTVKNWIEENPDKITRVIFCVFLETDFSIYKEKMATIFQDNDTEVAEEPLRGDEKSPSMKSPSMDGEIPEEDEREEETGEKEGDKDAAGIEDVVMESQNLDEDSGTEELNQVDDKDETGDNYDNPGFADNNEEDQGIANDKDKDEDDEEKDDQPAEKTEDDGGGKSSVEIADVAEIHDPGTSNDEGIKDDVAASEEPETNLTDSTQSKDAKEKKE